MLILIYFKCFFFLLFIADKLSVDKIKISYLSIYLSTLGFHPQTQNHLVQHNKQYHRKVLLSSFHLNGHTLGFHPQTQKLESPCTA